MDALRAYLPEDRVHALAHGRNLPDRLDGAALFADISGFTPLTEALHDTLGARVGSEVLSDTLNRIYSALIIQIHAYRGSVLGFAGDAITCWFDATNGPAVPRAAACALAMQRVMADSVHLSLPAGRRVTLALKVALACGPVRRFVVGDPAIQTLDLLGGAPLVRVAAAEHQASAGEVILDEASVTALGAAAQLDAWRLDREHGARFAPLRGLSTVLPPDPWPDLSTAALPAERLRPWLLPAVYTRETAGYGAFLTELRPAVALFVRFTGIDYDADPDAQARLDTLIRVVQGVLARFDGALLQVIIGDKGSYLCCAFGAPLAYEDDAQRAVLAALALHREVAQAISLHPLQVGISQGIMRCGAYGAPMRRTYGILGDDVNLAARLMGLAAPGETLISGSVQAAISAHVTLEPRPPIQLKGKAEPLPVFAVGGLRHERPVRIAEPSYALPIVGRAAELATVESLFDAVLAGQSRLLGITAEAGLGKSRLVAEVIRLAYQHRMSGYGGACQAMGTRSPYLVWQPIWRALFDLDPQAPPRRQIRALEGLIDEWAPDCCEAIPLLGPLLGLSIPDTPFTAALEARDRQSALHALLRNALAGAAREAQDTGGGLLLVLEDGHWIDAASAMLLADLVRAVLNLPVLIVLAYRPLDAGLAGVPPIAALPGLIEIHLASLERAAVEQLVRAKLLQLFPARGAAVPETLVTALIERTQGNPFYLEEVLNYLHDQDIDPREAANLDQLELPASLHRLILSRLDQLSAHQQVLLRTSSVIGRRFLVAWLRGAFPNLVLPVALRAELDVLAELELTPLDTPEPELAYLFKHVITREVAYESLGAATRALLHGQLAAYLEQHAGAEGALLDLLAYHYEQSDDLAKKRTYLRLAGEAAAARYANEAALAYLGRALELAPPADRDERYALLLAREQVLALRGEREPQWADLTALAALAEERGDPAARAEVALRRARHRNSTGDYAAATEAAQEAIGWAQAADRPDLEATALQRLGFALCGMSNYAQATAQLEQSLRLATIVDDQRQIWATLSDMAMVAAAQGDYPAALRHMETGLAIARAIGSRRLESFTLNDLAGMLGEQGDLITAGVYFAQCLAAARMLGDRWLAGRALGNLGFAQLLLGNYAEARKHCAQSLALTDETGDRQQMAFTCGYLGMAALRQGDSASASAYYRQSLDLAVRLGDRFLEGQVWRGLGNVALAQDDPAAATQAFEAAAVLLREVGMPALVAEALAGLARVALARNDPAAALTQIELVLAHLERDTLDGTDEPMLVYLTCYQALRANADARAPVLLARAQAELQVRAVQFTDPAARARFLEAVAAHRELMRAS